MRKKIPLHAFSRPEFHQSSAYNGNFCLGYLVIIFFICTGIIFNPVLPVPIRPSQSFDKATAIKEPSNMIMMPTMPNRYFRLIAANEHQNKDRGKNQHGSGQIGRKTSTQTSSKRNAIRA